MIGGRIITELSSKRISPIGIGTWGMGGWVLADRSKDREEIEAIRFALDNGINVIDTAEIYGRGHAEELVSKAMEGCDREKLFIITKIWVTHLSHNGIIRAAGESLRRLKTKYIDLYLIHWPKPFLDMKEAIGAMEELVDKGIVRSIGVSNFGVEDLKKAIDATKRYDIAADEIEYSLLAKGAEEDVIPFCEQNGVAVIAYTPLAKGRVTGVKEIRSVAESYRKTPIQVALNYLTRRSLPIPKSSNKEHIKEILGSIGWELKDKDYELLSKTGQF